jgi:hypothetical protein
VSAHTIAIVMLISAYHEPTLPLRKLKKISSHRMRSLVPAAWIAFAAVAHAAASAAPPARHASPSKRDVAADFRTLAQQRPWTCPQAANAEGPATWPDGESECAWQNRLRKQSWRWSDGDGDASTCISKPARWWHRAQAGLPPGTLRSVWDARWNVQTLQFSAGGEQHLLLLEHDHMNRWQATEWRWAPHPRLATRRWQQGRWALLVESVARRQPAGAGTDTGATARMQPVFRRLAGTRPAELGPDGLALDIAGLCLRASNPLPGQPKLSLSYSPNDSRLEQRAAMHLQLSRLHPDAQWLTQFKLLGVPANAPGGAKFLATWIEGGQLKSQLWMPAKGDAATVRILMTAPLPRGDEAASAAQKVKPVVERELETIAHLWTAAYE